MFNLSIKDRIGVITLFIDLTRAIAGSFFVIAIVKNLLGETLKNFNMQTGVEALLFFSVIFLGISVILVLSKVKLEDEL